MKGIEYFNLLSKEEQELFEEDFALGNNNRLYKCESLEVYNSIHFTKMYYYIKYAFSWSESKNEELWVELANKNDTFFITRKRNEIIKSLL